MKDLHEPRNGSTMVFEDVTVIPMDSDRQLPHRTVLVDDGRVVSIKPTAGASTPPGAKRIDGRGKYLMPGLADMHCHPMSESHLLLFVAHGVTTVRNLHGMPRHLIWRQRIGRGELLGPTIYTSGPIVGGRPSRRPWVPSVSTKAEARQTVAAVKRAGYDSVKVYDCLSPYAYGWVFDAAVEHDLPVYGHVPWSLGLHGVLRAGQRSIEHMQGFLEALLPQGMVPGSHPEAREMILPRANSFADERFQEVAEATRASGAWSSGTLVNRKLYTRDLRESLEGPDLPYLSSRQVAARRVREHGAAHVDVWRRIWPLYLRMTKALSDAGAGLLAGTDSPMPGELPGRSLHEDLQCFIEAGLTPFQALRAATSDAARFLDAAGEWGVVSEGARADLLLLDADPLADVANVAKIAGVMPAGRWYSADELRGRLDRVFADKETADGPPPRPTPDGVTQPTAQTRSYETEQAGRIVGTEHVAVNTDSSGGYVLRSRASMQRFVSEGGVPGVETANYSYEIGTDADGIDRSARFDYDGVDAHESLLLTKDGDKVRVRRTTSWSGEHTDEIDAPGDVLLSRPYAALWVQAARQLADLDVGATCRLRFVGPGLVPGIDAYPSELSVERVADRSEAGPVRRCYRYDLQYPNFAAQGTLMADAEGWPVEVEMASQRTGPLGAVGQEMKIKSVS